MKTWTLLAVLYVFGPSVAVAEDCAEKTTSGDIILSLESAEARFSARDKTGVFDFAQEATGAIPCLRDELGVAMAARFHRVHGLSSFLKKDQEQATLWFAAARQIQPEAPLSESLVPEGHPLQALYASAAAPADVEHLKPAAEGRLRFDGSDSTKRPTKRPTIFQYVDGAGAVKVSALLNVGDPVPLEGIKLAKAGASTTATGAATNGGSRTARIALLTGSGAALVTSAVTFVAAHGARSTYGDTQVNAANKAELERLYKSNRTLTTVSGVSAGLAASMGVGAVFVGHW